MFNSKCCYIFVRTNKIRIMKTTLRINEAKKIENFGGVSKMEMTNIGEYVGKKNAYFDCITSMNVFECIDGNTYGLVLKYVMKDHMISLFDSVEITDFVIVSSFALKDDNGSFNEIDAADLDISEIKNTIIEREKFFTRSKVILEWNGIKFNGKVYGKKDAYVVYLKGEKVSISNEDADMIKKENDCMAGQFLKDCIYSPKNK